MSELTSKMIDDKLAAAEERFKTTGDKSALKAVFAWAKDARASLGIPEDVEEDTPDPEDLYEGGDDAPFSDEVVLEEEEIMDPTVPPVEEWEVGTSDPEEFDIRLEEDLRDDEDED